MKKIVSAIAVLVLLFSCAKEEKGVVVTAIHLNKTELTLAKGSNEILTVTFTPENVSDKTLTWESSDTKVVTVADGIVVAVAPGKTEIIVKCGEAIDRCTVTVVEVVDLGIVMTREDGTTYRLYWAKSNLSEDGLCLNPEDYGDYYAWGETETKDSYNWSTYKFGKSSSGPFSKYNTKESYGKVDNKTILDTGPEGDDVASKKLGGKWRMPTDEEWTALREKCTWIWTAQNGVNGRLITSKANSNSIFLPAAGGRDDSSLNNAGSLGLYWSSSLTTGSPSYAWYVYFDSSDVDRHGSRRYYGLSVRPVSE